MKAEGFPGAYLPPFQLGEVLTGGGLSQVAASGHPDFAEGDLVQAFIGWEEFTRVSPDSANGRAALRKVPKEGEIPLSYYLGVLGMPGITAHFGFFDICEPKKNEKVFVSAAAGAVGQLVGQLAKLSGCYVVGSAGSQKKVDILVNELGFDAAFNYKEEADLSVTLKKYFPEGIDIYFENVGGKTLDAVLGIMNPFGRISGCGMISQYNLENPEPVYNLFNIVSRQIKMEGFLVTRYMERAPEFFEKMSPLLAEKKIKYLEDVTEGIENAPSAFVGMLNGKNIGKAIVKIASVV